ncbi:trypsin alpha-3-like [Schistocerca gregaria]|uniref:trypsin alpha-3-like n=1 Tax=Schistocerca gregaria TaxID=7010 RepID=UPI00211DC2C9|nr:trypsin alpha-3-like [Schistocerca gregaria]
MSRLGQLALLALALSAAGAYAAIRDLAIPSRPRLSGRIVGGAPANITQFPWQLYFITGGSSDCGASIVSSIYALTSARCVVEGDIYSMQVRAGSSSRGSGGSLYTVTVIFWHASFDGFDNDIGGLRVSEPFVFGPDVQAIPVTWNETAVGSPATVAGWGVSSSDGSLPSELQAVTVEIIDTAACNATYGNLTINMICAGVSEGGKDFCAGDEGSALVSGSEQVGIVSWNSGCGLPGYPGVYTYVVPLRNWIYGILGGV